MFFPLLTLFIPLSFSGYLSGWLYGGVVSVGLGCLGWGVVLWVLGWGGGFVGGNCRAVLGQRFLGGWFAVVLGEVFGSAVGLEGGFRGQKCSGLFGFGVYLKVVHRHIYGD